MAYTPPTQQQILAGLINTYDSLNPAADDMNIGSVVRSLLTSTSIGLKQAYTGQMENILAMQRAGMYSAFNFNLLQPTAAYTMEQFTVPTAPTTNVNVPAGVIVKISGTNTQYQTIASSIWPAGVTTQNIRIVCMQTGTIGNTFANTITQLVTPIAGLAGVTVTNTKPVINGTDLETEEQRAQRFTKFVDSLHKGDIGALNYGAQQAILYDQYGYINEQVMKSQVVEGNGSNTIYIDNGNYSASQQLIAWCQQIINGYVDSNGNYVIGWKAAGIPSTVQAANLQQVTIAVTVAPDTGYTLDMVQTTIQNNLASLVQGLPIGGTLYGAPQGILYLKAIDAAIKVPGVLNFAVTSPTADIIPDAGTLLMLSGTPTITQS